jgi:hypothetical protein
MDASSFLENIRIAQNIVSESSDSVSNLRQSRAENLTSEDRARMFS